ncbi:hypothetical protein FRC20_007369, partial [Serendipita sp. 405]
VFGGVKIFGTGQNDCEAATADQGFRGSRTIPSYDAHWGRKKRVINSEQAVEGDIRRQGVVLWWRMGLIIVRLRLVDQEAEA